MQFFEFFTAAWADFTAQGEATQIATGITIVVPVLGLLLALSRLGNMRAKLKGLEADKRLFNQELRAKTKKAAEEARDKALKEALEEEEKFKPSKWLEYANKNEREKYEDAIGKLLVGFDNVKDDLSEVTYKLASHYTSTIAEDPEAALRDSERLSRLSVLLDPDNRPARMLRDEILLLKADAGTLDSGDLVEITKLPSERYEAESQIEALLNAGDRHYRLGNYLVSAKLFGRGVLIAKRALLLREPIGLDTQLSEVGSLERADMLEEALFKVRAFVSSFDNANEDLDIRLFEALGLEAKILCSQKRTQEALTKIIALIEMQDNYPDKGNRIILRNRSIEVNILHDLDQNDIALNKVQSLLSLQEDILKNTDRDLLSTLYSEAKILLSLGNYKLALRKVNTLIDLDSMVFEKEAPERLWSFWLKAKISGAMGNEAEGMRILDHILPILKTKLSDDHRQVVETSILLKRLKKDLGK